MIERSILEQIAELLLQVERLSESCGDFVYTAHFGYDYEYGGYRVRVHVKDVSGYDGAEIGVRQFNSDMYPREAVLRIGDVHFSSLLEAKEKIK